MTIQARTTATNEQYNALLTSVKTVLRRTETGYGVLPSSVSIADGVVTAGQWTALQDDVERINVHIFDENFDSISPSLLPVPGNVLRRDYINTISGAIENCLDNRYTAHPNQLTAQACSSTRTSFWGSGNPEGISFVSEHVWPATDTANFFFNLGGYVAPQIQYVPGSDSGSQFPDLEQIIKDLITESASVIQQPFNRSKWLLAKQAIDSTYQVSYEKDVTLGNSTATFTATVVYQVIDNVEDENALRVSVKLIPDSAVVGLGGNIELNVVSTLTTYCSVGDRGGIGAVAPETTVVSTFEDAAAIAGSRKIVTLVTDRLDYSTTFVGGGQGSPIRVYVSNVSTNPATASTATITAIQLSNYGADVAYNAIPPVVIPPGETRYFDIVYYKFQVTSRNIGTFINSLKIVSNNTNGDLVIPISVTVTKPDFAVDPDRTTVVSSLQSYRSIYETFKLVSKFGRITSFQVTPVTAVPGFTVEKLPTSGYPTLRLKYTPVDVTDGQYQFVVNVVATGVDINGVVSTASNTLTWTVNQNIQDSHLGHWLSAKGANNSVVGISYDIIDSTRYITIGVGMGGDGSTRLGTTGLNFVNIDNLNYTAYPAYASGPLMYRNPPANIASTWTQFLKDYGVWFLPYIALPVNELFTYSFTVDIPANGTYTARFSVDDVGYMSVDGVKVIDLSATSRAWATTYNKDISLTAGKHTITLTGKNTGGYGAVAAAILTGNVVLWSTLTQVSNNAYAHWSEVYRIALSDDAASYLVGGTDYLVKDCRMNNDYRYSDSFNINGNTKKMFQINHDGSGNIEVVLGDVTEYVQDKVTLNNLLHSFYYYEWKLPRYNQLYSGAQGGTTPYFKGFDSLGNVLTVVRAVPDPEVIPSYEINDVYYPYDGGGGGYDGGFSPDSDDGGFGDTQGSGNDGGDNGAGDGGDTGVSDGGFGDTAGSGNDGGDNGAGDGGDGSGDGGGDSGGW